jgi:hypothetical protein
MKILILSFFLVLCSQLYSQGNLQFNRVVNYNLTGPASTATITTVQTVSIVVPTGKVWKIESASARTQGSGSFYNGTGQAHSAILIDNNFIILSRQSIYSDLHSYLPLWLAEGSHSLQLVVDNIGVTCSGCVSYGMITAIEFNIIP